MRRKSITVRAQRLRFSLRLALTFVTIICTVLGCTFGLPLAMALFAHEVLTVSSVALLIVLLVSGRKYIRAFAIGAIVPQLFMCLTYSAQGYADILNAWDYYSELEMRREILILPWLHSALLGVACIGLRQIVEVKNKNHDETADVQG